MKLLKEIFRKENLNLEGKTIYRDAVRGIIVKDNKLLMIHSKTNGDYKFPGGGIDMGENHKQALLREIKEESGTNLTEIEGEFGKVIEYNTPLEQEYDVFKMTSYYYICKVDNVFGEQNLDQYEKDLGFKPVWVDIDEAIKNNNIIMNGNNESKPRWLSREIYMLGEIKEKLFK